MKSSTNSKQKSPDAGAAFTLYDVLGRPILGMSASQVVNGKMGYTLYDALGRVTEGGERVLPLGTYFNFTLYPPGVAVSNAAWALELNTSWQWDKRYVTVSKYDVMPNASYLSTVLNTNGGLNSRGRITATLFYEQYNFMEPVKYEYGTFYEYDLTGNVRKLVQRLQAETGIVTLEKVMEYDYDLVSGKVNRVWYQKGQTEGYVYEYIYDRDNKLKLTNSSRDGLIWEREVEYFYYKHGPLARKVIGERWVQGLDYAYT